MTFNANAVYRVSRIVARGTPTGRDDDYAVMELDRVVTGYTPYRNVDLVRTGDSLTLIGHPVGLPKKFDFGGQTQSVTETLIRGTVDSYGGNSGSPIFDADGNLVGILVGGAPDFVDDGGCDVSNVCPGGSGCTSLGENIVPICALATATSTIQNQLNFAACRDGSSFSPASPVSSFSSATLSFGSFSFTSFFSSFSSLTSFSSISSDTTFTSFTGLSSFTSLTSFSSHTSLFSRSSSSSDSTIIIPSLIVSILAMFTL